MSLHGTAAAAKRALPKWVWSPARRLLTGVLTPLRFSLRTGHFKSSLRAAAVDRQGKPLPWYSYPAIDFLNTKDFSDRDVLEFGSGQSTLWWARRARTVVSFESDPEWFKSVRSSAPGNAEVHLIPDDLTGFEEQVGARKFDVIIVDGLDRLKAASRSPQLLEAGGAIILDNSDGGWGRDIPNEYPILALFRSLEFSRVDFYGHCPGLIRPQCTSIFFKDWSFLFRGERNVVYEKLPEG